MSLNNWMSAGSSNRAVAMDELNYSFMWVSEFFTFLEVKWRKRELTTVEKSDFGIKVIYQLLVVIVPTLFGVFSRYVWIVSAR